MNVRGAGVTGRRVEETGGLMVCDAVVVERVQRPKRHGCTMGTGLMVGGESMYKWLLVVFKDQTLESRAQ